MVGCAVGPNELLTTATTQLLPMLPHLSSFHLGCGFSAPPCPACLCSLGTTREGELPRLICWVQSSCGTKNLPPLSCESLTDESRPSGNISKGGNRGWGRIQAPLSLVEVEAMCQVPTPSWNLVFSGTSQWISTFMGGKGLGHRCSTTLEMGQQGGDESQMYWERVQKKLYGYRLNLYKCRFTSLLAILAL